MPPPILPPCNPPAYNGTVHAQAHTPTPNACLPPAQASNRVILYERNGLQHGGFEVPGGGAVERMEWSRDSELLALVLREEDESG